MFGIFKKTIFLGLASFLFLVLFSSESALASRPNIILIQTDDQTQKSAHSFFVNRKGKKQRTMPNLYNLIKNQGTEFTNYTISSPSCAPSRAALLSGRYGHNTGMVGNGKYPDGNWFALRENDIINNNIVTKLDSLGYKTAHVGKFYNGYKGPNPLEIETEIPPGWDSWVTVSSKGDSLWNRFLFYGYYLNWQGIQRGPFGTAQYQNKKDSKSCNPKIILSCRHQTDMTTALALSNISSSPDPLYLQIDFSAPHGDDTNPTGPEPSARHFGTAEKTPMFQSPRFNEKSLRDKPLNVRRQKSLTPTEKYSVKTQYQKTLESLRGVDDAIKHIVDKLRATNKLDNTYIIFTSDNGFFFGEHAIAKSKYSHYKPASNVPFFIRGPGVPVGESKEIVSNIDIAPTIADIVSIGFPADGRSMRPFWENSSLISKRPLFIENLTEPASNPNKYRRGIFKDNYQGIVTENYKFVRYFDGQTEIYDLKKDPHELYNQSNNPGYRQLSLEMLSALERYKNCFVAWCRKDLEIYSKPGEFITDSKAPPSQFSRNVAYVHNNSIFLQTSCPKIRGDCEVSKKIKTDAFSSAKPSVISARKKIPSGNKKKIVSVPIPSEDRRNVFYALWWQKPVKLITTTQKSGKTDIQTREIILVER